MVSAADNGGVSRLVPSSTPPQGPRADSLINSAAGAVPAAAPVAAQDTRSALPETVVVKPGDTMGAIAARYQVPLEQLRQLNPQIFSEGADSAGKKRGVDGRLIYPGDTVRLRAAAIPTADPIKTTTVSNKVVQAAKEYLDNAAIITPQAAGGKGREVSQRVVDSARKMLTLIPESDAERPRYANRVDQLVSEFLAQYPDAPQGATKSFDDASRSFNTAARAFQDAKKVAAQLPPEDLQAFLDDTVQRALTAANEAAQAVLAMPAGDAREERKQQLAMLEMAMIQMGVSPGLIHAALKGQLQLPTEGPLRAGGGESPQPAGNAAATVTEAVAASPGASGTQQPVGELPGAQAASAAGATVAPADPTAAIAAATQQPIGTLPGADVAAAVQPVAGQQAVAPTTTPAAAPPPAQPQRFIPDSELPHIAPPAGDFSQGYYTQRPGEIAVYHAQAMDVSIGPRQTPNANATTNPSGTNTNNTSNSGSPSQPTDAAARPKKDPNDPKIKQLWDMLAKADHKDVRDLIANNFDLAYASLPEQKARMLEILLDGMTTDKDQATIFQIVELSRQQAEHEDMVKELDGKMGGAPKGMVALLDDLKRGVKDQVLESFLTKPPNNYRYGDPLYMSVANAMDSKDVEHAAAKLGASGATDWMDMLPPQPRQTLIDKFKSWFSWIPLIGGGNKSLQAALEAAKANYKVPAPGQPQAAPQQPTQPQSTQPQPQPTQPQPTQPQP